MEYGDRTGRTFKCKGKSQFVSAWAAGVLAGITALTLPVSAAHAQTATVTTIHSFDNLGGPATPQSGLIKASDGNFYGTSSNGGVNAVGSIYQVTSTGAVTTLYSFDYTDGQYPYSALVQGKNGNFYGTTDEGGPNGSFGTVFMLTPAGKLTTLHAFLNTDGQYPAAGLIQAKDGSFYGATGNGGAHASGTIYKITAAGKLTTLYSFSGPDGLGPMAGVIQGGDGNFYGTTHEGGLFGLGTVFSMTPSGTLTTLHSFAGGADGAYPSAALLQANDGRFYGVTTQGGAANLGTLFALTSDGTMALLYSFAGPDGAIPIYSNLMQAKDGNLYGMTSQGGTSNRGTIFQFTLAGALHTLYSFSGIGTDGDYPRGGLMQAPNGTFYATTYGGGGPTQSGALIEMTVKAAKADKPTFDPAGGTHTAPVTVTISESTPGSTLYYTLDGTTPTTQSTVYTMPIDIETTTTLKALAAAPGFTHSAVAVAKYTIK
jgi:uncharacterized repeat protein (TIGR03803 family)